MPLTPRSVLDCGSPLPLFIRPPLPVDSARGQAQSTTASRSSPGIKLSLMLATEDTEDTEKTLKSEAGIPGKSDSSVSSASSVALNFEL